MLIQLRDGGWIDPTTVIVISSGPNGNKMMGGYLVNIYMREEHQHHIWFPDGPDAQVTAESYRDALAVIINDHQRIYKQQLPKDTLPAVWPEEY